MSTPITFTATKNFLKTYYFDFPAGEASIQNMGRFWKLEVSVKGRIIVLAEQHFVTKSGALKFAKTIFSQY